MGTTVRKHRARGAAARRIVASTELTATPGRCLWPGWHTGLHSETWATAKSNFVPDTLHSTRDLRLTTCDSPSFKFRSLKFQVRNLK